LLVKVGSPKIGSLVRVKMQSSVGRSRMQSWI